MATALSEPSTALLITPDAASEAGEADEAKPVITFDHVSKIYGEIRAVDDASATIRAGQIVGLIGPNGSGKTTLLRMLSGLARPTHGSISVLGTAPTVSSIRQRLGMVGARFPVARRRSGAEVLDHIAGLRQLPDTGRAADLADRLSLDLDRRADELSRGNLQKLALVQAMMHRPEVLLLDEPTVGLDPVAQRTLNELLAEEQARGTTIVMSSHVLSAVHTVATHVLAIRDGRIVIDGPIGPVLASTGRTVDVRVTTAGVEPVAALLRKTKLRPHGDRTCTDTEWTVTGRHHGDPNELIRQLANTHVVNLTIAEPQLDDLVDSIYRTDAKGQS